LDPCPCPLFAIRSDLRHLCKHPPARWKVRDRLSSEITGAGPNDLPFANRSATRHPDPIRIHPPRHGNLQRPSHPHPSRARPSRDIAILPLDQAARRHADDHSYASVRAIGQARNSRHPLRSSNQSSATCASVPAVSHASRPRSALPDRTIRVSYRSTASVAFTQSIAGQGDDRSQSTSRPPHSAAPCA